MMAGSDEKPWESIWLALWRLTTGGRRRFITIPLFVLFVTMPAIAGFTDGLGKLRAFFYKPPTAPLSRDEWDVYEQDEWVLVLDTTNTFEQANKEREQFKIDYSRLGHKNFNGQDIWSNDVLVVRSPRRAGQWLVVIDMYDGQSSRQEIQAGVDEMLQVASGDRDIANVTGRWLNGAAPAQMMKSDFIRLYGDIVKKPGAL